MKRSGYRWRALAAGALVVGLAVVHPAGVRAATDTVSVCDDSGAAGTLRSVIASAAAGDTVTFSCSGTITLTSGGGGAITLSKNLTIDGSGQAVTLSGGHTATVDGVQVFVVNSGVTAKLNDLTIANGNAPGGSAGGGIENSGILTVANSTFSANSARNGGGGIENSGILTVTNSTFSGNSADGDGGGGIDNYGTLSVTNSTFSGNSTFSASGGGGILNIGPLSVTNSTFSANSAYNGGGILNDTAPGDTATVTNSTFSANSANRDGGGIDNVGSTLSVTNSTFSGNSANSSGGAIVNFNQGTVTLANTILANSPSGGDCRNLLGTLTVLGTVTDNGGNLADNSDNCGVTQVASTTLKLGALASNGGSTQTIALGAGSVASDHASANCPSADQRGVLRPDNGEATCDSGAYESGNIADTDLALANVPANIIVNATSPAGAVVTYTAPTAVDEAGDSAAATVACDHAPGATFPIGITTVTCTATDADDANSPVSASFTVTVAPASQAITFTSTPPSPAFIGATYVVGATGGGSGNPVTYTAGPGGVCTSTGSNGATITLVGVGTCTVTATQAGNASYLPAPSVAQSFAVSYPPLFLSLGVSSSPAGPVTTGSVVTATLTLGNHTTATQAVCVKLTLTYTGSHGSLSLTVPLRLGLHAGQTLSKSASFTITTLFPRGTYTLAATATDGSGDTAGSSATLTVT